MTEAPDRTAAPDWLRRGAWGVFWSVLAVLVLIHQPDTGWNVNTRLALVFAVVDQQTFAIDAYHASGPLATMDKATIDGRFYSDKVFGVSVLAIPLYAVVSVVGGVLGIQWPFQFLNYILRVWAVSIPAAASVALLWMLLVRLGAAPRRAVFGVGAAFFGSMWFGYSTVFMPYSPGIAATMAALYLTLFPRASRITPANSFAIGLLCGVAMICDFIFGLIVIGVGVVYLMRLVDQTGLCGMRAFAEMKGPRTRVRNAGGLVLVGAIGGILPLALFFAYTYSIFGKLSIPYEYEVLEIFREGMAEGFMGIKAPRANIAYYLTLHPYRGVFFWSPWIVLALIGCVMGTRSSGRRRMLGWLGLWAFVSYLVFNSGYYMWWGGYSMGPRLMLPMMVALPLGLAEVLRRDRARGWWYGVVAAGVVAMLLSVPQSLMNPQPTQANEHWALVDPPLNAGLQVPQFVYLEVFYTAKWFAPPGEGLIVWSRVLGALLPLVAGIGLLRMVARRLPEKHLPFERLELPFVQFDGTAAPPPPARTSP